jgi:hypothetical protein
LKKEFVHYVRIQRECLLFSQSKCKLTSPMATDSAHCNPVNIDAADNIIMVTSNMAMISARPAFWPRRMSCDDSLRAALLVIMASECSELAVTL